MEINLQQIFWNRLFPLITLVLGSILTIVANYWREKSIRNTQIKIEKIKMYDGKKFQAYSDLYEFINKAFSLYYPPDNPREDFINIIKGYFFKKVKINYPYFNKDIREKIKIFEDQYDCLIEPDLIAKIPFEQFYKKEYLKILNELKIKIESIFDKWEHN
jgi:hypothetical protein